MHLRRGLRSQSKFKVQYTKPLLKWEVNSREFTTVNIEKKVNE